MINPDEIEIIIKNMYYKKGNTNNTNSNIVSSNEPKPKMVGRKRKRYYLQYKFHFKL